MMEPIATLPIAGGRYVVSFARQGDVLEHTLGAPGEAPQLTSITTPGLETPVLVEIHVQERVCYLTGMSGDRYWSMTVQEAEGGPGQAFVEFDVACRAKSPLGTAGSVYASKAEVDLVAEGAQVAWRPPELWITHNPGAAANTSTLRYRYEVRLPLE